MTEQWFHPSGALARGGWDAVVDDALPGWSHTGLRIGRLAPGNALELPAGGIERLFVPLAGAFEIELADAGSGDPTGGRVSLDGRTSPVAEASDVLYLPVGRGATVRGAGRIAVAEAPARRALPLRRIAADEVPVELRGGGRASRLVRNFGVPGVLDADRLIVCEVVTPSGNWSSYPAHKHDEHVPGRESRLEEIYYFEAEASPGAPGGADAFGVFAASSSPAGRIELDARVRTGDIALVPYGYHGPAGAAPGSELYYLNVMAGPDPEREWLISDDPHQAWVREQWPAEGIDPRLTARATEGPER